MVEPWVTGQSVKRRDRFCLKVGSVPGGGGGYSGFQVSGVIEEFLGLKFSIPGFFWVGKFGKYFFVWLDLSGDLIRDLLGGGGWGIQNNLKIRGSARESTTTIF